VKSLRGDPKAVGDSSRGIAAFRARFRRSGALGPLILCIGLAAALLLVLTEVTTLFSIDVATATCSDLADPDLADRCDVTGGEQHSFALVPLAFLIGVMAVGAGVGGSRPAGIALVGAGVVILVIALAFDLPDTTKTGEIGSTFASAEAVKGPAFWFELIAGLLAAAAGMLRLRYRAQVTRAT
jgi:hypothetical protein